MSVQLYTALDAFADGGIKMGLPRATALKLAAHTMIVSASNVLVRKEYKIVFLFRESSICFKRARWDHPDRNIKSGKTKH